MRIGIRRVNGWLGGLAAAAMAVAAGVAAGQDLFRAPTNDLPVEVKAARMDYDRDHGLLRASGHVSAVRGAEELRADRVVVNTTNHDCIADGNVRFFRSGQEVWRGDRLHYNFATKKWESGEFTAVYAPFSVQAAKSMKVSDVEYRLNDAWITTCSNGVVDSHYTVRGRTVSVIPGDRLKAYNCLLYLGRAPVFYVPFWYRDLSDSGNGFAFEPGYRSRMGYYLLTTYRYRLTPALKASTELDYRSKRGFAVGQGLKWNNKKNLVGGTSFYFLDDTGLDDGAVGPGGDPIESGRYRFKFANSYDITSQDYVVAEANYLSDSQVIEDFFTREYRRRWQPDNYAAVTHRGDDYAATLLGRVRLNDFYTSVDRLPEASLDMQRQEIGESPFYYEGQHAAAFLRQRWPETSGLEEYDAFRLDTLHTLYYPTHIGFLSFIPRAGYRGTFYSKTLTTESVAGLVTTVSTNTSGGATNLVTTTLPGTTVRTVDGNADLRNLFELGFETSFRAFRVWEDVRTESLDQLRHVVEPYARYTLVPEPNLTPTNLYQFDSIDALNEQHTIQFGARNKFQTRRNGRPFNLVNVDTYTTYNIKKLDGQDDFSDLFFKTETRLVEWLAWDFDGSWSFADSQVSTFNTQVGLPKLGLFSLRSEYRYRVDDTSLVSTDLTFTPNRRWAFDVSERYDLKESRAEEHGAGVQRTFDCLVFRLGLDYLPGYTRSDGTEQDDDYRVMGEVWLTAFPDLRLGGGDRN